MARTFATAQELDDYVKEQLQDELTKLPLPCRKPDKFVYGTSFKDYIDAWTNYADAIKIPVASRYSVLLTFLDSECQALANGLGLTDPQKAAWNDASRRLTEVLDKYTSASALKKKFLKSVQQSAESITEFGTRISRLFNHAFEGNGDTDLLCSVFMNGIRSDTIAIQMTANEPAVGQDQNKFHLLLKQAQELESTINSRIKEPVGNAQSDVLHVNSALTPTNSSGQRIAGYQQSQAIQNAYGGDTHSQRPNNNWMSSPNSSGPVAFQSNPNSRASGYQRPPGGWAPAPNYQGSMSHNFRFPRAQYPARQDVNYGRGFYGNQGSRNFSQNQSSYKQNNFRCYKCGVFGHSWRTCWRTRPDEIQAGYLFQNSGDAQPQQNHSFVPHSSERFGVNNKTDFAAPRKVHFSSQTNNFGQNVNAAQRPPQLRNGNDSTVNLVDQPSTSHNDPQSYDWDSFAHYNLEQPEQTSSANFYSIDNLNC